jgi:hypothetical protein
MTRPTVYIAITNHGFGHAVRAASVAGEIQRLNPDVLLILVTTAPRWLLESYIKGDFIYRSRAFDVGVIQSDSINMDKDATLKKLIEIKHKQNAIVAGEVSYIQQMGVNLIFADIPPLATVIAKNVGLPCWMMSNFGWDFIYRHWGGEFNAIADWISANYHQCDRLFRLPLHEEMSAFPSIQDTGLTGGIPNYQPDELIAKLGIAVEKEKTILLTFGGLGLEALPYNNLDNFGDWQFITFDYNAPELPNLLQLKGTEYRPVDMMPICGKIISKPGYSTFSEALRLNVPIVSLKREGFAESPLLLEGIKNYAEHQIINQAEFFLGNWDFLHQPMNQPKSEKTLRKDGTETIAKEIVEYLSKT